MPKKIGCAGIIVEDTICGPLPALPREGLLLALDAMPVKAGGCAANVAIDLARQGIAVDIAGCVGRDASADFLQGCLEGAGVGCARLSRAPKHPTSKTVILLIEGQDRRYLHVFGSNRAFTVAHMKRSWVKTLDILYLGGLFVLPGIKTGEFLSLLKFCRARGITTVVDVVLPQNWNSAAELKRLLPWIDYFLPNNDEAEAITGKSDPMDQLRELRRLGAGTVIITLGKAGSIAASGGDFWRCGTYPVNVVDPSGSGDAFSSGILTGLSRGWDLPRMLRYGSALGASATRVVGTTDGVFTAREAAAFVKSHTLAVATGKL